MPLTAEGHTSPQAGSVTQPGAGDFMELEIDGLGRQRQELTTAQA